MVNPRSSPLFTISQAAQLLGISTRSMRRIIDRGDLPAVRLSPRMVRISPVELQAYLHRLDGGSTL